MEFTRHYWQCILIVDMHRYAIESEIDGRLSDENVLSDRMQQYSTCKIYCRVLVSKSDHRQRSRLVVRIYTDYLRLSIRV
jgi:hypothetical protein